MHRPTFFRFFKRSQPNKEAGRTLHTLATKRYHATLSRFVKPADQANHPAIYFQFVKSSKPVKLGHSSPTRGKQGHSSSLKPTEQASNQSTNHATISRFVKLGIVLPAATLTVSLLFAASAYAAVNFTQTLVMPNNSLGLVGHWTFDGKDMIRNVADTSGQGNTGVLVAAATSTQQVPGVLGQALEFNGTNQKVNMGNTPASLRVANVTLSVWVNPATTVFNYTLIVGSYNPVGAFLGGYHFVTNSTGPIQFGINGYSGGGGHDVILGSLSDTPAGQWTHLVGTYDGTTIKLYKNGVLYGQKADAGLTLDYTSNVFHMAQGVPAGQFYQGSLDDVRIYNRALSAAEVQQLYNQGTATHQNVTINPPNLQRGLVGHWTFDGKDMIRNVADTSGQGNNGNLVSFTSTTTVPGVLGQGLKFNGTTQYVKTASAPLKLTSDMSYGGWFYTSPTQVDGNNLMPLAFDSGSTDGYHLLIDNAGTNGLICTVHLSGADATKTVVITAGSVNNKWKYILCVYNDTAKTVTVYENSINIGTSAAGSGTVTYNAFGQQAFLIGSSADAGTFFNGLIDDVRIYNRALSAAEVLQLYNQGTATHQNTTINPPNLNSGLVGHWTFDGKDMIRNVADTSGQGNNGNLVGFTSTTTVPGVLGQALHTNGTLQYVSVVPSGTVSGNFTVSLWANKSGTGGTQGAFSTRSPSDNSFDIQLNSTNSIHGDIGNGTAWLTTAADATYTMNKGSWYHIVYVVTPTGYTIYANGIQVGSGSYASDTPLLFNATHSIKIGTIAGNFFPGSIDDVRIYNRVLSPAEVYQLYKLGH